MANSAAAMLCDSRSLVGRIQAGDRSAEDELATAFFRGLTNMVAVRTGDSSVAPDLAQDTLIAVVCAIRAGTLRDPEKLSAFVHGTARNIIYNHLRTRLRSPREEPLTDELACRREQDPVEIDERDRAVTMALGRLNHKQKQILLLSLVEGLSPAQIAAQTNSSSEVIRTEKSRALKKVRDLLKKSCLRLPERNY